VLLDRGLGRFPPNYFIVDDRVERERERERESWRRISSPPQNADVLSDVCAFKAQVSLIDAPRSNRVDYLFRRISRSGIYITMFRMQQRIWGTIQNYAKRAISKKHYRRNPFSSCFFFIEPRISVASTIACTLLISAIETAITDLVLSFFFLFFLSEERAPSRMLDLECWGKSL